MRKGLAYILLVFFLFSPLCNKVWAEGQDSETGLKINEKITLKINGEIVSAEMQLFCRNGYPMLPLRTVAENLDINILWNSDEKSIVLAFKESYLKTDNLQIDNQQEELHQKEEILNELEQSIKIYLNQDIVSINGVRCAMETPIGFVDQSLFVSSLFISTFIEGLDIVWNITGNEIEVCGAIEAFKITNPIDKVILYSYNSEVIKSIPAYKIKGFLFSDSEDLKNTKPENLLLVNNNNQLPKSYVPTTLVKVPSTQMSLDKDAAEALQNMMSALYKETKSRLKILSCYRSYNYQKSLYTSKVNRLRYKYGEEADAVAQRTVALPGTSEHQSGLAVDVSADNSLTQGFDETIQGKWIKDNCYRFGFIVRYPEGKYDITGKDYEPWHLRFIGEKHAQIMYDSNMTLEEYIEYLLKL